MVVWSFVRGAAVLAVLGVLFVLEGAAVSAQSSSAGIVGVVRDESGGPLPGVTVEVTSPALIERAKVVVSNEAGAYQVVDLRPGEYVVSFALEGFQRVQRAGITLNAAFTATVDATLPVGRLQETVIVEGTTVIDTRSSTSERPLTQELLEGIPVGRIPNVAVLLVPGAATARPDVGGSESGQTSGVSIHGSQTRDLTWSTDGLDMTSNTANGGVSGQYPNQGAYQEVIVQTRALPADTGAGGVSVNMITKDGGNRFRGEAFGTFTNGQLQSDNVSDAQRARGLVAPSATDVFYDVNAGIGGPLVRDRLWFFGSVRRFRVDRFEAGNFNRDGTQALDENLIWNTSGKVTWQVNAANRVSSFVDYSYKLRDHRRSTTTAYQFISEEASYRSPLWGPVANVKWTSTLNSRLLLDSGFSWYYIPWSLDYQPDLAPDAFAQTDIALSTLTGAPTPAMTFAGQERRTWSSVLSWLPAWRGEHQIKTGVSFQHAPYGQTFESLGHGDFVARFRNGAPDSVIVYNTPVDTHLDQFELGVFAQDSWTIGRRVTINAGVRYERHVGSLDEQSAAAGDFVPARTYPAQANLIVWHTTVPRLAVAYDIRGDGRTVVKANVSQYGQRQGSSLVNQFNPLRQNSEVRTWTDSNGDRRPQLDEIGPGQGGLDRGATVRLHPDLTRPTQWEASLSVEHQFARRFAVTASYFHRNYTNLTAIVNVAVSPDDYTPLEIVNPLDGRPFTIYNQSAASIGRVDNVLLNSDDLEQRYHGGEIAFNGRFGDRLTLFGGVTVGSNTVATSASTNPNERINTSGYDPLDSRVLVNLSGLYRLPWRLNVSSHLSHFSGQPLSRVYTVTRNVAPALRQASQDVILVAAGDVRKPSQTLLDLRFGRSFALGRGAAVEPLIEIYNLLNENASVQEVEQVGAALGRISRNTDGRLVRFGFKVSF